MLNYVLDIAIPVIFLQKHWGVNNAWTKMMKTQVGILESTLSFCRSSRNELVHFQVHLQKYKDMQLASEN